MRMGAVYKTPYGLMAKPEYIKDGRIYGRLRLFTMAWIGYVWEMDGKAAVGYLPYGQDLKEMEL